jgi:hypothetical protein
MQVLVIGKTMQQNDTGFLPGIFASMNAVCVKYYGALDKVHRLFLHQQLTQLSLAEFSGTRG